MQDITEEIFLRQSREVKAKTRQAVVDHASRLFRERGIDGTSVGDVMTAAAKTHGGFYRHFESKEALLLAALDEAFDEQLGILDKGIAHHGDTDALARFLAFYLSPPRVADAGAGCPVAALAGDARRSGEAVRQAFGTGARRMIETIARTLDGVRVRPNGARSTDILTRRRNADDCPRERSYNRDASTRRRVLRRSINN